MGPEPYMSTTQSALLSPPIPHCAASGVAGLGLRLLGYRRFTRARVWEEERHAVLPAGVIRLVGRAVGP